MKEKLLDEIQLHCLEIFNFQWLNAHRLAVNELEFLVALLSKSYVQERALLYKCDYDVTKVEEAVNKVVEEEKLIVRYENAGH